MGGGTTNRLSPIQRQAGLSPRGRGNPKLWGIPGTSHGSIPAWAGEPSNTRSISFDCMVYPRVGGGTLTTWWTRNLITGLSPRGRGNLRHVGHGAPPLRSIPAWAGEPLAAADITITVAVYPRVGGGTADSMELGKGIRGLSPRGRGNR